MVIELVPSLDWYLNWLDDCILVGFIQKNDGGGSGILSRSDRTQMGQVGGCNHLESPQCIVLDLDCLAT